MEAQSSTAITGRDSGVTFIHDTNTVRIQTLAAISTGRGQNPSYLPQTHNFFHCGKGQWTHGIHSASLLTLIMCHTQFWDPTQMDKLYSPFETRLHLVIFDNHHQSYIIIYQKGVKEPQKHHFSKLPKCWNYNEEPLKRDIWHFQYFQLVRRLKRDGLILQLPN